MMRNLGILILLSAAALAQTPTAAQTPAAPATVTVGTLETSQPGKPSPSGAKVSAASGAATPKAKAVSVRSAGAGKTTSVAQKKAVSAKAAAAGKPATSVPKVAAVSVKTSAAAKPASSGPKTAAVSVSAPVRKPATSAPKATSAAKSVSVSASSAKPVAVAGPKAAPQAHAVSVKTSTAKPVARVQTRPVTVKPVTAKASARVHAKVVHGKPPVATVVGAKPTPSVLEGKPAAENKPKEFHGRDPFVSPVVAMGGAVGSGCSSGKRCLAIDQIALKGVVKSEAGMIAVVVNAVDKAYFLRENDPVFDGYVVKITGDSIIFKETFHDRLGKTLTRDVTKSITRPVA